MGIKSGVSAEELFKKELAITYLDFTTLDAIYTDIDKKDISLKINLGKGITLETPLWISPMDTVASADSCIAGSLEGCIGVAHYNHKDANGNEDFEAQVDDVKKIKRFQNGFIEEPITVSPENTIAEVIERGHNPKVSSSVIDTFPVTVDGKTRSKLVGLLRKQDYSKSIHTHLKVKDRMLPAQKLIVGTLPMALEDANETLWKEHLIYLPIVDKNFDLWYLVTRADLDKNERYQLATKDDKGRLRCLFAVDTWMRTTPSRLEACFAEGADGVVVDTSKGFNKHAKDALIYVAEKYPEKLLVGGNVSTIEAALFLHNLGFVDIYRNGQGPGASCTTAGTIGVSEAAASGVYESAKALHDVKSKMKTMADGGIKEVGDIFKGLLLGANGGVMCGKMFAGTDEAPGEIMTDEKGVLYKVYRGMGSAEANVGGIRGYSRIPEGVSGKVLYRGSLHKWISLLRDALLSSFESHNCKSIEELQEKMYAGEIRFKMRTYGAIQESGPSI